MILFLILLCAFVVGGLWGDAVETHRAHRMARELERRAPWRSP